MTPVTTGDHERQPDWNQLLRILYANRDILEGQIRAVEYQISIRPAIEARVAELESDNAKFCERENERILAAYHAQSDAKDIEPPAPEPRAIPPAIINSFARAHFGSGRGLNVPYNLGHYPD